MIKRAEGNAYFAEELLATSSAGSELPAGLADLLVARTVEPVRRRRSRSCGRPPSQAGGSTTSWSCSASGLAAAGL